MLPKRFHLDCSHLKPLEGALPRKAKNKIGNMPSANVLGFTSATPGTLDFKHYALGVGRVQGWKLITGPLHSGKEAEGSNHVSLPRAEPSRMEIFQSSQECQNLFRDKPNQGLYSGPGSDPVLCTTHGINVFCSPASSKEPDAFSVFLLILTC